MSVLSHSFTLFHTLSHSFAFFRTLINMSNKDSNFPVLRNYFISQGAASGSVIFFFPFLSRNLFTESKFTHPNFKSLYQRFFSAVGNGFKGVDMFFIGSLFYPIVDLSQSRLSMALAGNDSPTINQQLLSSFIVGGASPLMFNPIKATLVNVQNKPHLSSYHSLKDIFAHQGMKGLYRGSTFFSFRNAVFAPCLFQLSTHLNQYLGPASFVAAASIAVAVTMPMDIYSTQRLNDPHFEKYKSNLDLVKKTFQQYGFKSMYAGVQWRLLATTVEFVAFNFIKTQLSNFSS